MARPDGRRATRGRDVGVEAARRLKEILRASAESQRSVPAPPCPPPSFSEERRPVPRFSRRLDDDDQDE